MNCPKCKNPIADDSQECEWCGGEIIQSKKKISAHDELESIKSKVFFITFLDNILQFNLFSNKVNANLKVGQSYLIEIIKCVSKIV